MELPYAKPELDVATQLVFFLMAFSGLMLNLVVLFVVLRRKTPHTSESILMASVAVFDLIACIFSLLVEELRIIGIFGVKNHQFCYLDLFIFSTSTFASLAMTSALSIVRYINIVHRTNTNRSLFIGLSGGYLGLVWLVVIGRGMLNPLVLMPSGLYCMPYAVNPMGFQDFLETLYPILFLPCPLIILVTYGLITHYYYKVIRRTASLTSNYYFKEHMKNLAELLLVVVLYLLSILPEFIMSLLTLINQTKRTNAMDNFAFLAIFSLSILNPIFVLHLKRSQDPVHVPLVNQ